MTSYSHSGAEDQVRSAFQRWKNLEEEKSRIADDLKELFAEQKSHGHDTKAMRAAFRLKVKMDEADPADAEHEALVDTYLAVLDAPRATRAYARENIEKSGIVHGGLRTDGPVIDYGTVKLMEEQREAAMRSDSGLNIVTKHEDITAAPETAEELQHPVPQATGASARSGGDGSTVRGARTEADAVTAGETAPHSPSDDGAIAAANGKAGLANADGVEPPSSGQVETPSNDDADHAAGANAGGDHVESIAGRERDGTPTSNTGEGAACALPDPGRFVEDVPPTPMKRLHYAHCFPELTKAEYGRLEFSIIGIGVSRPIIRMGDVIVDGWARYNLCRALGISYPIKNYSGNDVLLDVIEWQCASRNFTPAQEKKIAAELAKEIPHRAGDIMAAFGLVEALEAAE